MNYQWIAGVFKAARRGLTYLSGGAIVAVGVILLRGTGLLQPLEWFVLDVGLTWTAPQSIDDRLLLITINDEDVENLQHYPIQDGELAQAIGILNYAKPAVIGLNLYRNFAVPPGSEALLEAIEETPEFVAVEPETTLFHLSPLLALKPEQWGIADIVLDKDGTVRRSLLAYRSLIPSAWDTPPDLKQSLATRLALRYISSQGIVPHSLPDHSVQWGKSRIAPLQSNSGGYRNLHPTGFQILLRSWRSLDQFHRASLTQLLHKEVPPDRIRDRIVLIGTISSQHGSVFRIPRRLSAYSFMMASGLEIQANTVIQLLNTAEGIPPLQAWPESLEYLWIFFWGISGTCLGAFGQSHKRRVFIFTLGAMVLLMGGSVLAVQGGWWVPTVPGVLALWGSLGLHIGWILSQQQKQARILLKEYNTTLERQIAERTAALMRSEAALNQAQALAHLGSWWFDPKTKECHWSQELFRIFGLETTSPPDPWQWISWIVPADQAAYQVAWNRLIFKGEAFHLEHQILIPNQPPRYVESRGEALCNAQEQVVRVLGSVLDITHRKQVELALAQSESRLQTLVSNISDGLIILDREGVIRFANPAAAQLFQRAEAELINFEWGLPISTEAELDLVDLKGNLRTLEYRVADTEWGGEMAYILALRDITDRKQAEEQIRCNLEQQEQLVKLVDRMRRTLQLDQIFSATVIELRQLLQCDRVAIYQFNSDWSGAFVAECTHSHWTPLLDQESTEAWKQSVGNDRCVVQRLENLVNADVHFQSQRGGRYARGVPFFAVDDIETAGFQDCYLNLLRSIQAKAYVITPIFQGDRLWGLLGVYQNDGTRSWKDTEINLMIQVCTQLAVAVKQSQLLKDLQKAKEEAEAASIAKGTFLANMSHELRTPLNAIQGFAQLLHRDSHLDENQHQKITTILRSSEHLLSLINDILDVSKSEIFGQINLHETTFNLPNLLIELMDMFQWKAEEKRIALTLELDPHLPTLIQSDRLRLRQILMNLLSNAIKFTDEGQVTLRTEVISQNSGGFWLIKFEVQDTGMGMTDAELETLFQPFVQTQSGKRALEGTGLGLSISRTYAERMGGTLIACSEFGVGSTFTLCLVFVGNSDVTQHSLPHLDRHGSESTEGHYPLDRSRLHQLFYQTPADWRQTFKNAILDLDEDRCFSLLYEIELELPDLAEHCRQCLTQFQYDRILEFYKTGSPRLDR